MTLIIVCGAICISRSHFLGRVLLTLLKNKESRLVSSSFLQTISFNKNK
ncbi:hypothetical protein LEP1GSC158_1780 [Leptospira interrogans serovar Zanoni str. LT2156]|uniref:Uncharacterized protein n=1 Tax=Leptospira interrogans serovar Zanoni str. LT2156 TaxID=1001601 RepID=M6HCV4_LEPIR|nr:hypothetical protein LEP1GSC158_1780 [Leptospira interrogans serovar Zanoni str. LT2156]